MKIKFLVVAVFTGMVFTGTLFAQTALPKGNKQVNFGVGFSDWGIPVYLGFDHAVHNDFTIGAEGSFRGYRERWDGRRYRRSVFGLAVNGNYHFNTLLDIPSNWDFYAGANLGFYLWNDADRDYRGPNSSGLGLGAQIGGRYYWSSKAGINLEFGSGNAFSGGKLGFTVRL